MRSHRLTVGEAQLELGRLIGLLTILPVVLFAAFAAGTGFGAEDGYIAPLLIWLAGAVPPAVTLALLFAGRHKLAACTAMLGVAFSGGLFFFIAYYLQTGSQTVAQRILILGLTGLFCGPFLYTAWQLARIARNVFDAPRLRPGNPASAHVGDLFDSPSLQRFSPDVPVTAAMRRARRLRIWVLCALLCVLGVLALSPTIKQEWLAHTLTKISVGPNATNLVVDGDLARGLVTSDGGPRGDQVTLFDTQTHRVVSRFNVGPGQHASYPVFDSLHGHAFVAVGDGVSTHANSVWMLSAGTGAVLRRTAVNGSVDAMTIDSADGHLFAGTASHNLVTLDTASGDPIRSVRDAEARSGSTWLAGLEVDTSTHYVFELFYNESPAPAGSLSVFEGRTGTLLRVLRTGAAPIALGLDSRNQHIFIANGLAPYGLPRPSVQVLDAQSGSTIRTIPAGSPSKLILDPFRDQVLLYDNLYTGSISFLDARTGILRHQIQSVGTGINLASLVDGTRGLAFSSDQNWSWIDVIDLVNGTVARKIDLDAPATALAVDARRHQVFAVQQDQHDIVVVSVP